MFFGQQHLSFDDQGYLVVPTAFRESLFGCVFVTQGFERNLLLLTDKAFQGILQRAKGMNIADPLARLLLRLILGNACELELDESGRIFIPQGLREFAGLESEAVLVGQGDYLEVWTPEMWRRQERQLQDAESNASRFAVLDIATG